MTSFVNLKKRLDQFAPEGEQAARYFHIMVEGETPVTIPDEYDPKADILFKTTYLDREGNEPGAASKLTWRGKPWS